MQSLPGQETLGLTAGPPRPRLPGAVLLATPTTGLLARGITYSVFDSSDEPRIFVSR